MHIGPDQYGNLVWLPDPQDAIDQYGDPSLGTDVVLPGGTKHFAPGETPYTFLSAGKNYLGGITSTSDPAEIAALRADARTRGQQAIAKQVAMGLGAAYLSNTPWSTGTTTGNGLASASDAAYGVAPEAGSIGAEGVGATTGASTAGWGPALGTIGGGPPAASGSGFFSSLLGGGSGTAGGSMGLGISDWLNIGNTILGVAGAKSAANTVSNASDAAIAEQRRQFDINQANQAPYQAAGVGALGNLTNPGANFQTSPGYQFRLGEGQRDIGNSFAARGGAFSGNALKALTDYNQNSASNEFGNWWNQQAGLAGVGQTANNQVGAYGQNYAGNVGNALMAGADARASGVQNMAGILGQGANNFVGNYLYRQRGYQTPYSSPYVGYQG